MGIFSAFTEEKDVKLIGVEAAGKGLETGSIRPIGGRRVEYSWRQVIHSQDKYGQIQEAYSVFRGLDIRRGSRTRSLRQRDGKYVSVTDAEALDGFKLLSRTDGIIPALDLLMQSLMPQISPNTDKEQILLVNLSGGVINDLQT
jgi:tryptophan synthase beta chain